MADFTNLSKPSAGTHTNLSKPSASFTNGTKEGLTASYFRLEDDSGYYQLEDASGYYAIDLKTAFTNLAKP